MKAAKNTPFNRLFQSAVTRRAGVGVAMLLVAAALSTLIMTTGPDGSATPQTEKAHPVTVMRVTTGKRKPMFATYGRVEARTEAKLRTDIQAQVETVYVQEGEWAEKGQLLIQLRAIEIELRLREANAAAKQAEVNLRSTRVDYEMLKNTTSHFEEMYQISQQTIERQQELAERNMIPQALLDTALQQASRDTIEYQDHKRLLANFPGKIAQTEAAYTMAQTRADLAALNLDKTQVRAPFAGPVLEVAVGHGDQTNLTVALLTMADASTFEVRASVPEEYADRVRQALDNKQPITADITDSLNNSSANSSAREAQLTLERIAHNVRPGQSGLDAWFQFNSMVDSADATQITTKQTAHTLGRVINLNTVLPGEPNLVALPSQAVHNNNRVYLVSDNRLEAATVERVGEIKTQAGDYQVLVRGDNLHEGTDVMTTALPKAITGLLVEPIRSTAETPETLDEALVESLSPQTNVTPKTRESLAPKSRA